ncbi:MAG: response regulator transcription factor [Flavobacteriaceae bacterium]|nr:response regulator transcription factor [Flavobacteriaceae bacterium]MCY4216833.1 response regulator transcription factor [Flavobacteriaceae bacterium]MCY4253393.1 response regulator transcription factor [Flavobacteriaceae bacterium]
MKKFKPKILIAEDNFNFGNILKDYLEDHNFNVTLAKDGHEALTFYSKEKFDLCILDIMMPNMDGFTLAEKIRIIDDGVSIFFLTAKNLKSDMLKGYKVGADDYLTKPFDSEVLLAKIKRTLSSKSIKASKYKEKSPEVYKLGNYLYNSRSRVLEYIDGEKTELSPKENDLLRLFAIYQNDLLPRDVALNTVWKANNVFTSRSMDVFIVRLRRLFSRDKSVQINNVHGIGFQLVIDEKPPKKSYKKPVGTNTV